MSAAYKCDACEKLYERNDVFFHKQRVSILKLCPRHSSELFDGYKFDLCDDCLNKVLNVLNLKEG